MVEEYISLAIRMSELPIGDVYSSIREAILHGHNNTLVFTDASFDLDNGKSACGVVIVNKNGDLLGFRAIALGVLHSAVEAEIIAIQMGLTEVLRLGAKRIIMLFDSMEAIKTLSDGENQQCWGGYTLFTIKKELSDLESYNFIHIGRDLNSAAHLLAKHAGSPASLPDWISNWVKNWVREVWLCLDF